MWDFMHLPVFLSEMKAATGNSLAGTKQFRFLNFRVSESSMVLNLHWSGAWGPAGPASSDLSYLECRKYGMCGIGKDGRGIFAHVPWCKVLQHCSKL